MTLESLISISNTSEVALHISEIVYVKYNIII